MLRSAIKSKLNTAWQLAQGTVMAWAEDKATSLGAALAYYSLFSLGPLMIIAIGVAGWAFGTQAARGQLFGYLHSFLGTSAAETVQSMIAGVHQPKVGYIAPVISIGTLVFAAISVVVQLRISLNAIWGVRPKADRAIYAVIRQYVIAIIAVVSFGVVLMASLLASAVLVLVNKFMNDLLPVPAIVLQAMNFALSFALLSVMFAGTFKYLPDVRVPFRDIWPGAIGTAFLFTVGKDVIGFYLGMQSLGSSYGAASSIVAILIWVYYLSQVLLLGAEFTKVYVKWRGTEIVPTEGAVLGAGPGPFGVTPGPAAASSFVASRSRKAARKSSPRNPQPLR